MLHASPTTSAALPVWVALDAPHRMALVIERRRFEIGEAVTEEQFLEAEETCDLSVDELRRHIGEATRIVHAEPADPLLRRADRVAAGARLVLGLMPQVGQVHAMLRDNGYETREVGDLWDDIIARAAVDWCNDRAPHTTGAGMPDWARETLSRNAE